MMTTKQLDAASVLTVLARLHGTTIEEEIAKHNADIERRIASGYSHRVVSTEERIARTKAVKRRALDKEKAKRAAARALKLKPSYEEITAKAMAKAERKRAARRRHRVKLRDALRAFRAKSDGWLHGGGPTEATPFVERSALAADKRRARKAETDKRYRLSTQEALRVQLQSEHHFNPAILAGG